MNRVKKTYSSYNEEDIFIENGQHLRIRTNEPMSPKTIYIEAKEKFSHQALYLPVHAEVKDQADIIDRINEPPYFLTKPEVLMIDIQRDNNYIYDLPEIIDQMNHTIFIKVKGLPKFMSFTEEKHQIVMTDLGK